MMDKLITELYPHNHMEIKEALVHLIEAYKIESKHKPFTEKDCILITYGDSITEKEGKGHTLQALNNVLSEKVKDTISAVHLLPFYPFSSDDGFSVIDYMAVRKEVGSWNDISTLASEYDLMFDGVINHISSQSNWVKGYLNGDLTYQNYFIECDDTLDYSVVTRPRSLPLLSSYSKEGKSVKLWTTFSADQIDLNFEEPKVFLKVMEILIEYIVRGARYIRLDAIGFLWKEIGTTCMHHPNTHKVVQLIRLVLQAVREDVVIITETNTPHLENISYFGNGNNEAHMVYQFTLPPLVLYGFMVEDATKLLDWLTTIEPVSSTTTFFNFLASHDGIGVRPVEGILSDDEVLMMADNVRERGGEISYRDLGNGEQKPYELNINYMSALCSDDEDISTKMKKFIASQAILLSVIGIPGIYIHSLFGSMNDREGFESTKIPRRINREKLNMNELLNELEIEGTLRQSVFEAYMKLLNIRKNHSAFSPNARQDVWYYNKQLFTITRQNEATGECIDIVINMSGDSIDTEINGYDLIRDEHIGPRLTIGAYEVIWCVK